MHPRATSIAGVATVASMVDLDFAPDLVVVAVPAVEVPGVLEASGLARARAAVVITAGFTEAGRPELETTCLHIARRYGMRLVGPNCLGVAAPAHGVNALFSDTAFESGSIALASQSGGLGIALLAEVTRRGAGISSFVSLGNKADVSGNDLLCFWAQDTATKCIALYLKSFGNGRRFARLARSVSMSKPIIALKSGRSAAGARGAASHTASMTTPDVAVDAVFDHAGVLRVDSLEELIDLAVTLDRQPPALGGRIGLVGNAGGPLILAADAASAEGLDVPQLCPRTQEAIRAIAPMAATTQNPVDLLATVSVEQLQQVIDVLAASGEVDAISVTSVPLTRSSNSDVRTMLAGLSFDIPVVASVIGAPDDLPTAVPVFDYPERAIRVLSRLVERGDWLTRARPEEASDDHVDWARLRTELRGEVPVG